MSSLTCACRGLECDHMSGCAWLPKIRLAHWRKDYYTRAFKSAQTRVPDLTLSAWLREAADAAAMEEFGDKVMPVPQDPKAA